MAMELTLWTDGTRVPTVMAVLEQMGPHVTPIGVGGPHAGTPGLPSGAGTPGTAGAVSDLAKSLACVQRDDLRQLIVERPPAVLLLATMESVETADLLAATSQGTMVLTLEPPAADLQGLTALRPRLKPKGRSRGRVEHVDPAALSTTPAGTPARIIFLPDFRQCPGFLSAAEPFETIGQRRVVNHQSVGPAAHGSLFARLFDAWRAVLRITPEPESVVASLVGPDVVPDSLRGLTGAVAAHGRMPDGSAAVIYVADHAGQTRRALHVIGDSGELHISDGGYGLWQLDGTTLDEDQPGAMIGHTELIAHQWRRLIDRPAAASASMEETPHSDAQALACCLACLLSARTAQPESPEQVLQMNR